MKRESLDKNNKTFSLNVDLYLSFWLQEEPTKNIIHPQSNQRTTLRKSGMYIQYQRNYIIGLVISIIQMNKRLDFRNMFISGSYSGFYITCI